MQGVVEGGRLRFVADGTEILDWPVEETQVESQSDGYRLRAQNESVIFAPAETGFSEALQKSGLPETAAGRLRAAAERTASVKSSARPPSRADVSSSSSSSTPTKWRGFIAQHPFMFMFLFLFVALPLIVLLMTELGWTEASDESDPSQSSDEVELDITIVDAEITTNGYLDVTVVVHNPHDSAVTDVGCSVRPVDERGNDLGGFFDAILETAFLEGGMAPGEEFVTVLELGEPNGVVTGFRSRCWGEFE